MSDYSDIMQYLEEQGQDTSAPLPFEVDNPNYYSSSSSNMVEAPTDTSGFDYLTQYIDMFMGTGAVDPQSELGKLVSSTVGAAPVTAAAPAAAQSDTISNVIDTMLGGIKKAYAKDPLAFLKVGLDTVGGALKSQNERQAADRLAQSRINEQNNAAAISQAKTKAYNDSFSYKKPRTPKAQAPLSRIDGSPIYDSTGRAIRR